MSYQQLPTTCPCCQAAILARVTVEDLGGDPQRGHEYDVSLELAPANLEASGAAVGTESCTMCNSPWGAQERQEHEQLRRKGVV